MARQLGSHFFVNANYTFVDSKITLSPEQLGVQTSAERPLAGQSENLFNIGGEAFFGGFSTRVLYNFVGDRISDVGANEAPDIVEQGRGALDVVLAQRIARPYHPRHPREPDGQRVPIHAVAGRWTEFSGSTSWAAPTPFPSATACSETRHDIDKEHTSHHAFLTYPVWDRCRGRFRDRADRPAVLGSGAARQRPGHRQARHRGHGRGHR